MVEPAFFGKKNDVFDTTPETIKIHIIWRGKLDVFSVAQCDNTKQQILFAASKLNQILTQRDKEAAHNKEDKAK